MSTPQPLVYPYKWCWAQVQRFVEKYARGTANLATLCGITVGETRHFLTLTLARGNSLKWEVMKRVVKYLSSDEEDEIRKLSEKEAKQLYRCIRVIAEDDALDEKSAYQAIDSLKSRTLF